MSSLMARKYEKVMGFSYFRGTSKKCSLDLVNNKLGNKFKGTDR